MTTPKGAWTVASMLFLYMMVNFADKAVVGLAAVPIMQELGLSQSEYGKLGSSFFLLFSISGIAVGFLANRWPTRWIILALATSWGIVQFPMIGSVSFTTLLACRVLLGAGEGPAASVAVHSVYKWFPDEKRSMPTAILSQGAAVGVIVALPALNWIVVHYSWHMAFGALGVVGLIWVVAWLVIGKEGPIKDPIAAEGADAMAERVGYSHILLAPTFIGCVCACFGAYWGLSLGLTWFTPFVVKALGFPQSSAGLISTLPWVAGGSMVMLAGWLSQTLVARGMTTRTARALVGTVPLILAGCLLATVPLVGSPVAKIVVLVAASGLTGPIYVVCAPMIAEFTPTAQRGATIAIFGAIYTLAGVIAPAANGSVIENAPTLLDGYQTGYRICAVIQVAGGLLGLLLMRPAADRTRVAAHRAAMAAQHR